LKIAWSEPPLLENTYNIDNNYNKYPKYSNLNACRLSKSRSKKPDSFPSGKVKDGIIKDTVFVISDCILALIA